MACDAFTWSLGHPSPHITSVPSFPHPHPTPGDLARAQVTDSVFKLLYALVMELEVRDRRLEAHTTGLFVPAEPAPWSLCCVGQYPPLLPEGLTISVRREVHPGRAPSSCTPAAPRREENGGCGPLSGGRALPYTVQVGKVEGRKQLTEGSVTDPAEERQGPPEAREEAQLEDTHVVTSAQGSRKQVTLSLGGHPPCWPLSSGSSHRPTPAPRPWRSHPTSCHPTSLWM